MIDALDAALRALTARSYAAYPLVALAGVASGIGPCAAPRSLALAALAHGARRPARTAAAFATGVVLAYTAAGAGMEALAFAFASSRVTYALAATAFATAGVVTLARAGGARCTGHVHERVHAPRAGGALLLGATSTLLVSPCCTPVIGAIAGLTAANGRCAAGVAMLVAFACGHALPAILIACGAGRCAPALQRVLTAQAPGIVAGTLSLALACYYAVLA